MHHLRRTLWVATGLGLFIVRASASGFYGPGEFLAGGGVNALASPEFYWDQEVKRLARDYHPTEKPMPAIRKRTDDYSSPIAEMPYIDATTAADGQDFADAIKTGEIKPADVPAAIQAHDAARKVIAGIAIAALPVMVPYSSTPTLTPTPLPSPTQTPQLTTETDSEFADYNRGAYAFRQGKDHWDEAENAWKNLLKRPAAERHYRTVWAVFMLGKLAIERKDPSAVTWFQQVRQFVKDGFGDSLGMAADSYGWEGRSELRQGHHHEAAILFLTQLALGDESAVVSLKALIPDRGIFGDLSYGPDGEEIYDNPDTPALGPTVDEQARLNAALQAVLADPLLRKLETAHILAQDSSGWDSQGSEAAKTRLSNWLKMIEEAKLSNLDDAEYLGWLAYGMGDYAAADRWLKLSTGTSAIAVWLKAKLELRAGDMEAATKDLSQAISGLSAETYTGWKAGPYEPANEGYVMSKEELPLWSTHDWACGDLGTARLARNDFLQALDLFLKGGMWKDAAFLSERVLSTDELKAFVDKMGPAPFYPTPTPTPEPSPGDGDTPPPYPDNISRMRYVLGRRLVREDRYAEAALYLPAPYNKICDKYAQALKIGNDSSLPKLARAKALFTGAWIARYDGMEIMGTELSPDGFISMGAFAYIDPGKERLAGKSENGSWDTASQKYITETQVNPIETTAEELKRLKTYVTDPNERWHYRYLATALAIRASLLLDDNTEELADVVNTAGLWIKTLDDKKGNAYYAVIERKCPNTELGQAVLKAHWFVDKRGPLSSKEKADNDAMRPAEKTDDTRDE